MGPGEGREEGCGSRAHAKSKNVAVSDEPTQVSGVYVKFICTGMVEVLLVLSFF